MKIAIPTSEGKLCAHFGHCETFSFIDVDIETKNILNIKTQAPEDGVSCQCASWLAEQGVQIVLAGGIGGRPMMVLNQLGIEVITGCPEMDIEEIVNLFINNQLILGENSCGHDEHHHCHSHGEEHHCTNH